MKVRRLLVFLLVSSALVMQACANTQTAVQTGVAQTLQISGLQTAAAGGGQPAATATPPPGGESATATSQPAGPSNTVAPSETATITLTPTSSIPFVSVSENTNCRTGPSANYGLVTTINTGQQVEVLKVYNAANYVVVRNPNGSGDCWLWLQYATPASFAQYDLQVATQPPTPTATFTPTPSFSWGGEWNITVKNAGSTYTGVMNFVVSGSSITGSTTLNPGAFAYTFSGSISASMQIAGGTYSGAGSGDWDAQIKSGNMNQFIGNLDSGTWEFCGARAGSSMPAPCLWP